MTAVTARRVVMSTAVWMLGVIIVDLIFSAVRFHPEQHGWQGTAVWVAALWKCNDVADRAWKWSKP